MSDVLHPDMAHEATDGSEPCIALPHRWSKRGPFNCCLCISTCVCPRSAAKAAKLFSRYSVFDIAKPVARRSAR